MKTQAHSFKLCGAAVCYAVLLAAAEAEVVTKRLGTGLSPKSTNSTLSPRWSTKAESAVIFRPSNSSSPATGCKMIVSVRSGNVTRTAFPSASVWNRGAGSGT